MDLSGPYRAAFNAALPHATEYGTIEVRRVYDSPFTSVAPEGPEAIFVNDDLDEFFGIITRLHDTAGA